MKKCEFQNVIIKVITVTQIKANEIFLIETTKKIFSAEIILVHFLTKMNGVFKTAITLCVDGAGAMITRSLYTILK